MNNIPLLLFAKAPVVGQVKTRLTKVCSSRQAADIAKILIEETIKKAQRAWPGDAVLCVWQGHSNAFIQKMCEQYGIRLLAQKEGDLGDKMYGAMQTTGYPVAILGCDAPHIPASVLAAAYKALSQQQNVIGPSADGGYYLIGLSAAHQSLFQNGLWGTASVLEETLAIAHAQNINIQTLGTSFDIDRWEDVLKAAQHLPALQDYIQSESLAG